MGAELLVLGHGFPKLITAGEGLDGRFCCVTDSWQLGLGECRALSKYSDSRLASWPQRSLCPVPTHIVFVSFVTYSCSSAKISSFVNPNSAPTEDLELNKIAGNTISSPVVGCILGVALAGKWPVLGWGHAGDAFLFAMLLACRFRSCELFRFFNHVSYIPKTHWQLAGEKLFFCHLINLQTLVLQRGLQASIWHVGFLVKSVRQKGIGA